MKINEIYKNIKEHPYKLVRNIIVLIIFIQFSIDWLYKIGIVFPLIKTHYGPNDLLSYWGTFLASTLGAGVTILGVYITISYYKEQTRELIENGNNTTKNLIESSKKETDETNRKSVLPFIVINRIITQYKGFSFTLTDDNEELKTEDYGFFESEIGEFYIIIEKQRLSLQIELNKNQELRLNNAFKTTKKDGVISFSQPDYAYFPFKLSNVGLGPAINMTLSVIKNNLKGDVNYHLNTIPFSMKVNQEIKLAFFVDHPDECIGDYKVVISYYDINSVEYSQEHQLSIMNGQSTFNAEVNQEQK